MSERPVANVDLTRWRADTPGCLHRNHLNNAGASLMPTPVIQAINDHISLESEIGGYEAEAAREDAIAAVYDQIGALVHAPSRNMAIVANATDGFTRSMSAVDLRRGDVILTSNCDYVSYQITFLSLAERLGIEIRHAPDLPEGGIDAGAVREMLRQERVRLVHVSWIPTNSGLVQDVAAVGAVCEEAGVPYVVDACQAVGQLEIDVAAIRCDYLSVTARKFLRGPRGIGFMYASDKALARGDHPLFVDMRGAKWIAVDRYELVDGAHRFEDWEFPQALVLGLGAAARYAAAVGVGLGGRRAAKLAADLRRELAELDGVRVLDRGREQCAIVTIDVQGWDANDLVAALSRRGINTTASLRWYGLIDFTKKGTTSALRLSPHYYNTEEEVAAALGAVHEIIGSAR
ncbi:MAG TPA: aminotransferase class V-fold PLP-dependent enzyme [Gemmatimonadaceae bacterium]|nr:aminotransferase class V-fold PLP-dependent enzyme [Gemmatimonadaceae bacterium]